MFDAKFHSEVVETKCYCGTLLFELLRFLDLLDFHRHGDIIRGNEWFPLSPCLGFPPHPRSSGGIGDPSKVPEGKGGEASTR